jgi:multidrug efflux pump subunit AcrA (membrane-fusion protein)
VNNQALSVKFPTMDLSFAKDPAIWSKAVESLRLERANLTDAEVIKARYEEIEGKGKVSVNVEMTDEEKEAAKAAKKAEADAKKAAAKAAKK